MDLSIVIAVFNEEEVLTELERRLTAALRALRRSYEIILVDDGSRDRSLDILVSLREKDPEHIRIFSFTRNFGHHIALTAGLDHAKGEIIVMMDADLQDQPEEIPKLLAKMDEGYEVVWGEREARQFKWYKNLSSWAFLWTMNSLARSEVRLDSSIFRAMRKSVADDLRAMREKARYLPGLVRWIGYRQTSVPVVHGKRFAGQTKYSFWRLIKLALSTATSFSAAPLQFATLSGMVTAGVAVLAVLYILLRKMLGGYAVPGYASIMIAIFFFGALQLIVIGLMGEYVSRIYRESQGRPLYLLKDLGSTEMVLGVGDTVSNEIKQLSSLSDRERESFLEAIGNDVRLPMKFLGGNLSNYHFEQWKKIDPIVYLEKVGTEISAACLISELEWDTKVLGIRSGRIHYANAFGGSMEPKQLEALQAVLRKSLDLARSKQIRLLDARVSTEDLFITRAFEQAGFHLVDILVTMGTAKAKFDRVLSNGGYRREGNSLRFEDGLCIRPMQQSDAAILTTLSESAYGDHTMIQDRFFLEPSIAPDRARQLFVEWFRNLARNHHEGKAIVLVSELNGQPCGYIGMEPMTAPDGTLWLRDSLNAVAEQARGRGVYRSLVLAGFDHAQRTGAAGLFTKTQASTTRVINSWLHLGADLFESTATLHWTA
ncbi:MAG TPA: glycosyltransferase [Candidatus Kapabacteria bacterium]